MREGAGCLVVTGHRLMLTKTVRQKPLETARVREDAAQSNRNLIYGHLGYRVRVPLKSNTLLALFLIKQVARDTEVTPRTRLPQGSVFIGSLLIGTNDWN